MSVEPRQNKALQRRRRTIRTVIIVVVVLALLTVAVFYGRSRVRTVFGSSSSTEVETAQVTTGSITSTVSGSGTLISEDLETVTLPTGVEIDTVFVETGDMVEAGDVLASVDSDSVLRALADVQSQLDALDVQLEAASGDSVSSTVSTGVSGRVKIIYAGEGDDVSSVMAENGALMLLSLDGYMSAEIEAGDYVVGDAVTVTASDGTVYAGVVSRVSGGLAEILVSDDGPILGDTVTVDGAYTGILSVHEPLKITGYAGTVSEVNAAENEAVSVDDTLFTLTDTSYSANYNQILEERRGVEETFQDLISLYRDGVITAPTAGIVESVPDGDGTSLATGLAVAGYSGSTSASSEAEVFALNPGKTMSVSISVDETDILSVEPGQEVSVTVNSIGEDTIYTGEVTGIDTTALSAGGVTVYTVTAAIEKAPGMMAGMTASVNITIEGVEEALIVPEEAVQYTSDSAYVYTQYDEAAGELGGMTEVTCGLSNGTYIEITQGLREGDTVYYTVSTSIWDTLLDSFGGMGGFGSMGGGPDGGGSTAAP